MIFNCMYVMKRGCVCLYRLTTSCDDYGRMCASRLAVHHDISWFAIWLGNRQVNLHHSHTAVCMSN